MPGPAQGEAQFLNPLRAGRDRGPKQLKILTHRGIPSLAIAKMAFSGKSGVLIRRST
jgi:hypothetical protein